MRKWKGYLIVVVEVVPLCALLKFGHLFLYLRGQLAMAIKFAQRTGLGELKGTKN